METRFGPSVSSEPQVGAHHGDSTVALLAAEAFSLIIRAHSTDQSVRALRRKADDDPMLLRLARDRCDRIQKLDEKLCAQAAQLLDTTANQIMPLDPRPQPSNRLRPAPTSDQGRGLPRQGSGWP